MSLHATNSRKLLAALFCAACLCGGTGAVVAAPGGDGMQGMHGGGHGKHGGGGHGKQGGCQGKQGGGGHAKHGGGGHGGHGGPKLYGADWKSGLTDEQKSALDRLHAELARVKAPAKARVKAAEVELAVLATAPQLDAEALDAKISELLESQRVMLKAKYEYIAGQRSVLTPEQQTSFDMHTIHNTMHGGEKGKGGGHH